MYPSRNAIVPASAIIAALGALSAYTFVLIGRSCAKTKADSYEQAWSRTVGEKSAWLPASGCVATCFAGCLAYTLIIGDSFSALAKTFGAPAVVASRSNIIMALSATVLLPLSLLKSECFFIGVFSVGITVCHSYERCNIHRLIDGPDQSRCLDSFSKHIGGWERARAKIRGGRRRCYGCTRKFVISFKWLYFSVVRRVEMCLRLTVSKL